MKTVYRSPMVLGVILAAMAVVYFATSSAGQPARPNAAGRWEYKVMAVSGGIAESDLNAAGAEGWELVSFAIIKDSAYTNFVFKRPKQP